MSVESMAIVLHHSKARGTAKVVMLGIANHDGDGGAWPSIDTLAKYANVTRRNARDAIKALAKLGEVEVVLHGGGDPSMADTHRPNLYRVLVDCPADCDRSKQHRTSRRRTVEVELQDLFAQVDGVGSDPGSVATPGVVRDPDPGSVATPEPSLKPDHLSQKANHSTRARECEKSPDGQHKWEPSGWCTYGEHRRLEAVTA